MAITVDATPSGASANSYVTVAEADAYVDVHVLSPTSRDSWSALEVDDKARLVIQATRQLDWYFEWEGIKTIFNQPLDWPRSNVYRDYLDYVDPETIPSEIQEATIELALWLQVNGDNVPVADNNQYSKIDVGPISIDFNDNAAIPALRYIPDKIVSIVQSFGSYGDPDVPSANKARSIRLVRS